MKKIITFIIGLILLFNAGAAWADERDDFEEALESRQRAVTDAYDKLDARVKGMNSQDPKKDKAEDFLRTAQTAAEAFKDLEADGHIVTKKGVFEADDDFEDAEKAALKAINEVNRFILSPARPGDDGGTVPEGDLRKDFIPQFIRLLFKFASAAILISIVVSSVLLITAMDNEERVTKSRQMLIWSLIGFAFIVMAFALVKAVTQIDFFGSV